jgi:uncharacterized iron-regulated membrane protein
MLNFILFCVAVLAATVVCFWFRAWNHGLWRQILYKIHLWLGIVSGIVLFIVCLTGTILAFNAAITDFFEYKNYFVSHPGMSPLKIEDLIAKVEQDMNGKVYCVQKFSSRIDAAYIMAVKPEDSNISTKYYVIDPYTGESLVRRKELLDENFWMTIYLIHVSLYLPHPYGRTIVGSATLIFVVIALSGLCLWLPANFRNKKAWLNGFIVQFRKGKSRLIYDLHKTLGFFVLILVLLMALTGLIMSFDWFCNGVAKILNIQHSDVKHKSLPPSPDAKPLPLAYFVKKADELMIHKDEQFTIIHDKKEDTVFTMGSSNKAFKLFKEEIINFDKYSGEVLKHDRFENRHLGEKIIGLTYVLHVGSVLGLPSTIIYFLTCLIATTLPITGVIIWWRKLRNLRRAKNNKITENQQKSA